MIYLILLLAAIVLLVILNVFMIRDKEKERMYKELEKENVEFLRKNAALRAEIESLHRLYKLGQK